MASLTLIAPAGLGGRIDGAFIAALVAAERRRPAQEALARLVADPSLVSREMVERFLRYKRLDGVPEALATIAGQIADGERQTIDLAGRLPDLRVPLLVIAGAADAIVAPTASGTIPATAEHHEVDAAGHLVHMEQSAIVNAQIASFIDRN